MKGSRLFLIGVLFLLIINLVSASRLPTVGGDEDDWGTVLNDFLSKIAGSDGVKLNETMVNGTNIYSSSINTTHIKDGTLKSEDIEDGTITSDDLGTNSVTDNEIDYIAITLSDFTNDANYLDKDEGGAIDGSLIVNGNFTLIGAYLNATVTNQYLNGSFLPEITDLFDLGSSLLKWANLYVTNIYASKIYSDDWSNVTIEESQISDLQGYLTSESDPIYSAWDKDYGDLINTPTIPTIWDATFNTTGDNRWGGIDTQKLADGIYLYNDTSTIYFNETKLNETIDNKIAGISGDNSSWNESYADTLYMDINQDDWIDDGEESDLNVNSSDYWDNLGTINETQMENNGGTLNILVSWLTSLFYTESEVDNVLAGQDECSEISGCVENAINSSNADIAFVNATGDTMTGNLNVTGNITTTDTFCFNADCSAKMYHNGSGIIISS